MFRRSQHVLTVFVLFAGATWATVASAQQETYDLKSGEVVAVRGNNLIVRGPDGATELSVSDDFRFDMDGQQLSVHQLKPGMKLTALIKTTDYPLQLTVTEVRNAQVVYTIGNSLVVRTQDDGQYRRFTSTQMKDMDLVVYKDGQAIAPSTLRKGDVITAVVVTKLPPAVLTQQQVAVLAQKPEMIPPQSVGVTQIDQNAVPALPNFRTASGAGTSTTAAPPAPDTNKAEPKKEEPKKDEPKKDEPKKELPKTGSSLPSAALSGGILLVAGAGLTAYRRFSER